MSMAPRSHVTRLWILLSLLFGVILFALGRPLTRVWHCYGLATSGEYVQAEVVDRREDLGLILKILSGSLEGQACTAGVSKTTYDKAQPGDIVSVVARADRPGECELVSTLNTSVVLLWVLSGATLLMVLLVVMLGFFIHRSYTVQPNTSSHFGLQGKNVSCPECGAEMTEGYLPLLAGLHWRHKDEPVGMPHVFSGLSGTVGWRGRPRLHGYHCEACQIITVKYGRR